MGKTTSKRNVERHDPLHVELADNPDQGMRRKTVRQKFVERNQRDETVEVPTDPLLLLCIVMLTLDRH